MKKYLLLLAVFALAVCACEKPVSKYIYNEGFIYGTMYHMVYESPEGKDLHEEIKEKLSQYNLIFSTFDKNSVISKVNNNADVEPGPGIYNLLQTGNGNFGNHRWRVRHYRRTNGKCLGFWA
jgi:thiamine biosynthesis lipoprotein